MANEPLTADQRNIETLSQIECVLRIHWSPLPFEDQNLERLVGFGLIERKDGWYRTTEKGRVWVEAIRAVPLPVAVTRSRWEIPK